MKLSAHFNNDSHGGLSPQLEAFLTMNLPAVNELLKSVSAPAAVVVREDGNTAFFAKDMHAHLSSFGITEGDLFRAALQKPADLHLRMVYMTALGAGAVDVFIEEPAAEVVSSE